jgi:predicted DNA-binding transcriptional regulator AlpA
LGISKNKAYEVVNRYDFPKIRVGRRIIISKKHFLEWMDANFSKERNNT